MAAALVLARIVIVARHGMPLGGKAPDKSITRRLEAKQELCPPRSRTNVRATFDHRRHFGQKRHCKRVVRNVVEISPAWSLIYWRVPMTGQFRSISLLIALCTLALFPPGPAGSSMAATVPDGGVLDYAVLREGDEIGSHIMKFSNSGDVLEVDILTDVRVKLAFITLYRFWHKGWEQWRNGRLVKLISTTDDDGTDHKLQVFAEKKELAVFGDGAKTMARGEIIPASLWHMGMVRSPEDVVLNTLDGTKMAIKVDYMGEERVKGLDGPVLAKHFVITGELERELWYDKNQVLVKVRFKGSDGSDIQYVLR
ncbi:MAG: DUF6134 family protein [Rhodospirillales bacterium]|nr:DUF6134 family protein [Rhodospirillales bacterium]